MLTLVPPVGGSLGILTIMLGLRARRKADGDEPADESAVFAVWIGLLAIALSVVMASLMVGMLADGVTELPGSETP